MLPGYFLRGTDMQTRSRRGFLGACAAGLAALGLAPVRARAADPVGSEGFSAMVGDRFYLANHSSPDQGRVKMIALEEVDVAPELDQFHVRFRGRRGARLPEGMYAVTNWDGHPYFDVHVLPTGVDSRNRELYLASFAQLR